MTIVTSILRSLPFGIPVGFLACRIVLFYNEVRWIGGLKEWIIEYSVTRGLDPWS